MVKLSEYDVDVQIEMTKKASDHWLRSVELAFKEQLEYKNNHVCISLHTKLKTYVTVGTVVFSEKNGQVYFSERDLKSEIDDLLTDRLGYPRDMPEEAEELRYAYMEAAEFAFDWARLVDEMASEEESKNGQ
jgi:hypothetical protein